MECESCGSKIEDGESFFVSIEGARLNVCFRCKRFGKIIHAPRVSRTGGQPSSSRQAYAPASRPSTREEYELVENYGERIRNAREKIGLPLNVLAEKIAEKESFIDRVEKQKTRPPFSVAKKLEKELGILLLEEVESQSPNQESPNYKKSSVPRALTLGDILEIEKGKKKKSG